MVIVKIHGGLGNQMFQYAMGRRTALVNNVELKFDLHWFEDFGASTPRTFALNKFNIQGQVASDVEINRLVRWEKFFGRKLYGMIPIKWRNYIREPFREPFNSQLLDVNKNVYLDGYWGTEKYFSDICGIIKKEFELKQYDARDESLENKLATSTAVSIHVRRGDYATLDEVVHLDSKYYNDAIDVINSKYGNCEYYVFSDDVEWVKSNINFKCKVNYVSRQDAASPNYEIVLMSKCACNIIANSTFSWWGAWLNNNPDKTVVAPAKWFKDRTYGTHCSAAEGWIRL